MKKMNKKLISILLAVIMIFGTTAVGLTAFADDPATCNHENTTYTFVSRSGHSKICTDCGETLEAEEPHDFEPSTHKCKNCGYVYDCDKYGHISNFANEFNDDTHSMVCAACGKTWTERHNYDTDTHICSICSHKHNGCEADGHYYLKTDDDTHACVFCGDVQNHNFNTAGKCIDCGYYSCTKFGHVIEPGYHSNEYYHWIQCKYCDELYGEKELHIDETGEKTNEGDGLCDVCGYELEHRWQLQEHEEPNCLLDGYDKYYCLNCGADNIENIPRLGHKFTDEENGRYIEYEWDTTNYQSCRIIFHCANFDPLKKPEPGQCDEFISYTVHQKGSQSNNQVIKVSEVLPTCTETGTTVYRATFTIDDATGTGWKVSTYTFTNEVTVITPALGHDFSVFQSSKAATCLDPAIITYKCSRCDETNDVVDENNPALGHNFVYSSNGDATCTEDGTKTGYCSRCEATDGPIPDEGSKLGHTPRQPVQENYIEATCRNGSYDLVTYCDRCGEVMSRESVVIPATGVHDYNNLGFCKVCGAYDCEGRGHSYVGGYEMDDNYHWKECAYCGAISSDGKVKDDNGNVVPADGIKAPHVDANEDGMCDVCTYSNGHKWQLVNNQNPTCSAPGFNEYTCAFHPEETKRVDLPPLGHYWYDDHNEADRQYVTFNFSSNFESCTLTLKCRRPECGQTVSYTVYTDPSDNGAVLANATTNKPISKGTDANCEAGSGKSYYAIFTISQKLKEMGLNDADLRTVNEIINQDSELRDIIQANGLNPKLNVNEKGLVCILTYEDGVTPALGHIYEDPAYMEGGENYQPNGDATCTKDGTRTAPCDRCGKVSDTVPDEGSALGHDFREEDLVVTPATCTEDGLATGTCTRCNQKNEQVIPALGHDWVEDESKYVAPTCGKEGQRFYDCSRCDATKTEAIDALAHTPDPSKAVVVAPTCTEEGYTKNYCSVCQQYYNTDYTPARGHTWGEWSEKIYYGNDCTKNGYQIRTCEVCGATEQKEVPGSATGHVYVYTDIGDEDHHLVVCAHCGDPRDYKAHVDGNYDFICDECGHEMSFWHHWLHYMVGLPTYGFGNFFTRMMDAFTRFIRMITKDMI